MNDETQTQTIETAIRTDTLVNHSGTRYNEGTLLLVPELLSQEDATRLVEIGAASWTSFPRQVPIAPATSNPAQVVQSGSAPVADPAQAIAAGSGGAPLDPAASTGDDQAAGNQTQTATKGTAKKGGAK